MHLGYLSFSFLPLPLKTDSAEAGDLPLHIKGMFHSLTVDKALVQGVVAGFPCCDCEIPNGCFKSSAASSYKSGGDDSRRIY